MAFLGRCYGCRDGNHEEHTDNFDTPPPSDEFICGGGICVCYECVPEAGHLDDLNPNRPEPNPAPEAF